MYCHFLFVSFFFSFVVHGSFIQNAPIQLLFFFSFSLSSAHCSFHILFHLSFSFYLLFVLIFSIFFSLFTVLSVYAFLFSYSSPFSVPAFLSLDSSFTLLLSLFTSHLPFSFILFRVMRQRPGFVNPPFISFFPLFVSVFAPFSSLQRKLFAFAFQVLRLPTSIKSFEGNEQFQEAVVIHLVSYTLLSVARRNEPFSV